MPVRDESDRTIYGIDEAWLGEVLQTWNLLSVGRRFSGVEMLERPSAAYTNALRWMASRLQGDASSTRLLSACPSGVIEVSGWTDLRVHFGDVPPDVAKGDEVRRSDVADMFAWMGAGGVKYAASSELVSYSHDVTQTRSGERPNWSWCGDDTLHYWVWASGGSWARCVATHVTASAVFPDLRAEWFDSVVPYLRVGYWSSTSTGTSGRLVPADAATMTQTAAGLRVDVSYDPSGILEALGLAEVPYGTEGADAVDGSGYCRLSVYLGVWHMCFFHFADDYRHPGP